MNRIKTLFLPIIIVSLLGTSLNTKAGEPLIVAHRGLLHAAPENTLSNFRACLELRLGFEFDVQRTRDGKLICMHDTTVDRTSNGSGKVAEMTWEQVQQLDVGSWFDARFTGERVPSVQQVLKLVSEYRQHSILIAVDFKDEGVEQEVVQIAEQLGVLDRLIFIGRTITASEVRANLKQASPKAETAVIANTSQEFPAALADKGADWVYVRYLAPTAEIKAVHRAGKRVFIAGPTVSGDLPENWKRAASAGIDAILTDYPVQLRSTLRAQKTVD